MRGFVHSGGKVQSNGCQSLHSWIKLLFKASSTQVLAWELTVDGWRAWDCQMAVIRNQACSWT